MPGGNTSPPLSLNISTTRLPTEAIESLIISFPSQGGRSYRIEESNDMRQWSTRETGIPGNGDAIQRSIPATGKTLFLRVTEAE